MRTFSEEKQHFIEKGGFEIKIDMKLGAINKDFVKIPPAKEMIVFLRQHIGVEAEPLVNAGDSVKYGQKIGKCPSKSSISANVHSPVNGKVVEIKKMVHPISRVEENAIFIETTDEEEGSGSLEPIDGDVENATTEQLLNQIHEAGIVGLGGAAFPSYIKLKQNKKISHLIINAKESDPNIAADHRIIAEFPNEILKGIKIMAKILNAENIIFATRLKVGHLPEFESLLQKYGIKVTRIRPNYSVGSEKLLIKELLGKEIPSGKLPHDLGVVVHNVSTTYAVWDAVYNNRPLVSRGLTLYTSKTGGQNLWVRMGTPIEHIFKHLGISPSVFNRVVLGSLMMGPTVPNSSYPILKATSGITAFTDEEEDPYEDSLACIRCSYCNIVCPVDIYPVLIMEAEKKKKVSMLKKLNVQACIECGLCSYVCPSRIKFTPFLTNGKKLIR